MVVQASIINQIDDNHLNCLLIINFHKVGVLILNLQGQELITCSPILNRTLTMRSDKTLKYNCAKLSRLNEYASKYYKKINRMNIIHDL